jgi:hypothetical protein
VKTFYGFLLLLMAGRLGVLGGHCVLHGKKGTVVQDYTQITSCLKYFVFCEEEVLEGILGEWSVLERVGGKLY